MKVTESSQRPLAKSQATETENLSGQIFRARVKRIFRDHCDLELLSPDDGAIAQGRLYQSESMAWKDLRLLADIPHYNKDAILEAVYVNHLRHEEGQEFWYVHERWGVNNPWADLVLNEDDIVTGIVVRRITSSQTEQFAGYIIQLDTETPLLSTRSNERTEEYLQPDIEVFLPSDQLPWEDGSLGLQADKAKSGHLPLEIGDPIQGLVFKIQFPPLNPLISLTRLIAHRDAMAERDFNHRDVMGRWRFRRIFGNISADITKDEQFEEHPFDEVPYSDRRFLLVDDDSKAMASQAELLMLMGAHVTQVLVEPNNFAQAISEVVVNLRENHFDLALIDNNLPGRDLGQTLIERVREQIGDKSGIRFVLLTANSLTTPAANICSMLHGKGVSSMLHRPVSHPILQRLLAGEEIWEISASSDRSDAVQNQTARTAQTSVAQLLNLIAEQNGVFFAILMKAERQIKARDIVSSGRIPFGFEQYNDVLTKTDLHLLVDGRISEMTLTVDDAGSSLLRTGRFGAAYWHVIESVGERWILGIGHDPEFDIAERLPLWCVALAAMVEAQAWRDDAEHNSSFVQLGLAHHGLSHEIINLEDEIGNLLDSLRRWLDKQVPGVKLDGKVKDYIDEKITSLRKNTQDLLDLSKRQLRGHAFRHQMVFLPDAVEFIKRIVDSECREGEVGLHVSKPPSLALPVANAALVLPAINLLINAAKHHYRRENRRVELFFDYEEHNGKQFIMIDVRDNGPGLDQACLKRLWRPGYSSASKVERRHGIGLWLASQLVHEAGGSLKLYENWRGLGACFRLRFPIHLG